MSNKDGIIVIKGDEEENKKHKRLIAILIAILLSIALITYTGVNLIYSPSTITVGVVELYPLKWAQGSDYATAASLGYATGWSLSTKETYFSITVKGSPELTVIIDDIFRVVNTTNVVSFKVEIATVISGSLKSPTDKINTLKLRFWDGDTPPTSDADTQVKGVLNLEDPTGTKTVEMTIDDYYDMLKVQIIIELASNALTTETATVQIRFTDIIM
jgi:flagellar basal body-associated protein FliL